LDIQKEINRIIGRFILKRPVLGAISLRMKYVNQPNPVKIPGVFFPFMITPATNTITYDENKLKILQEYGSEIDIELMLAHEAMHVLTGSLLRVGDRDVELWNIATDFEINYLLKDMGFNIPDTVLYSSEFHEKYYYAEKIYDLLLQEAGKKADEISSSDNDQGDDEESNSQDNDNNNDQDNDGDQEDSSSDNDQDNDKDQKGNEGGYGKYLPDYQKKQLDFHEYPTTSQEMIQAKANTQTALSTAAQIERSLESMNSTGTLPASVKRLIEKLMTSQVTWKDLLCDVTTSFAKNNYSYRRCNPNYRTQNIYVPTLHSPESKVVVIVDTSGSIGSEELRLFISEVIPIMGMFNTTFITCDAEIYTTDIVENALGVEDIIDHIKGGGGTVFAPAFQWVEENIMENCTIVLMTDGYNADEEITIPFSVEKTVVLTVGDKPSGFEPDVLIKVDLHPKESW